MSQATSMRKRHRFNSRMTRIVLLISFIFFFGRFILLVRRCLAAPSEQKRSSAIHTLRRITGTTLAVTFSTFTEPNALRCRMLLLFGIIKAADILSS
ncbi:protein [Escherichia coli]|uniref:Protein n=1 Tax=Escherichia coli TaxID=562 RepID=A0A376U671_ECOLX|nr:protein [Escherichia coli]